MAGHPTGGSLLANEKVEIIKPSKRLHLVFIVI
jgi:hypothetical protein